MILFVFLCDLNRSEVTQPSSIFVLLAFKMHNLWSSPPASQACCGCFSIQVNDIQTLRLGSCDQSVKLLRQPLCSCTITDLPVSDKTDVLSASSHGVLIFQLLVLFFMRCACFGGQGH